MKIKFFAICVIVMLLCFTACSDTSMPYQLVKNDDGYYMVFKNTAQENSSSNGSLVAAPKIEFHSLAELRQDIKTGNFTEKELAVIQTFKKDKEGNITVCSIDKLYEPTLPEAYPLSHISWMGGKYYTFEYKGISSSYLNFFQFFSKERFDEEREDIQRVATCMPNDVPYVKVEGVHDRNAEVYTRTLKDGEVQTIIIYSIQSEGKTLYIEEAYSTKEVPEEGVPWCIYLIGEQYGQCFSGYISHLDERPSVEWLSKFGIREYVETATQ